MSEVIIKTQENPSPKAITTPRITPSMSNATYRGEKGDKGDKGDRGPKGDKGDQGAQGKQGIQGIPGPVGPEGKQGIPGPVGPTGPKGDSGVYVGNNEPADALIWIKPSDDITSLANIILEVLEEVANGSY